MYRLIENDTGSLPIVEVLAVGERADQVVYRTTFARLNPDPDPESGEPDSEQGED